MAKTLLAGMTTHIGNEVTTLSLCAHITRTDGLEFFFTNHDVPITFAGDTYEAMSGFSSAAIATRSDFGVDNTEIEGFIFDSSTILEADLRDGYFDFAEVEFFYVNWQAPDTDGQIKMKKAFFGEVTLRDHSFVVELRGLNQLLRRRIGEKYSATCRAEVFDSGGANKCTLDPDNTTMPQTSLAAKRVAIVESVTSNREFVVNANATAVLDPDEDTAELHRVQISSAGLVTLVDGGPDGTPLRPFEISTSAELEAIPDGATGYYVLANNIDMSAAAESPFVPIEDFQGVFDGLGFEISNLDLDHSAAPQNAGLFNDLAGTVKRVGIVDATVQTDAGGTFWGAPLVARMVDGGIVEDCYAVGGTVTTGGDTAGGLVARTATSTDVSIIRRCWAAVTISGTIGTLVGGLCGSWNNTAGTFENNYFDSDVAGTTDLGNNGSGKNTALDRTEAHVQANYTGFDFANQWVIAVLATASGSGADTYTFNEAGATDNISRSDGSLWGSDGFAAGQRIQVSGTTSNNSTGMEVSTPFAATLILTSAEDLTDEGPLDADDVTIQALDYPRIMDPGRC